MGKKHQVSFGQGNGSNPYSGKSKEELLAMYDPEVWGHMENSEKIKLLQATGEIYSQEHGVEKAPTFVEEPDDGLYGSYMASTNTVSVNLNACKNPYEALDTVGHEVNHAYQEQSIKNDNGSYTDKERALLKAEDVAYRSGGKAYDRQSLEQDSNNAGVKYVLGLKENFKGKAAFQDYLQGREEHFDKVAQDYLLNCRESCASEISQVEEAYARGAISSEERNKAISCIADEENSIKTELLAMQEEIRDAHHEIAIDKECQEDLKRIAKRQHLEFDQAIHKETVDQAKLSEVYRQNENTLKNLNYTNAALSKEYEEKFAQLNQYVTENNMSREECRNDETYLALSQELSDLESQKSSCSYHIAELETDNQLMDEVLVEEPHESQTEGTSEEASEGTSDGMDSGSGMEME